MKLIVIFKVFFYYCLHFNLHIYVKKLGFIFHRIFLNKEFGEIFRVNSNYYIQSEIKVTIYQNMHMQYAIFTKNIYINYNVKI